MANIYVLKRRNIQQRVYFFRCEIRLTFSLHYFEQQEIY